MTKKSFSFFRQLTSFLWRSANCSCPQTKILSYIGFFLFFFLLTCCEQKKEILQQIAIETDLRNEQLEKQQRKGRYYIAPQDTEQTQCFSDNRPYAQIKCSKEQLVDFPHQDAVFRQKSAFLIRSSLDYPQQKIIEDFTTGLKWKYCPQGKKGNHCQSFAQSQFTFLEALQSCRSLNQLNQQKGYAGLTNWRLPDLRELSAILNYQHTSPVVNQALFPSTSISSYQTFSYLPSIHKIMVLNMQTAETDLATIQEKHSVRCVAGSIIPQPIFIEQKNQLLADKQSGLLWTKCPEGMIGDDCRGFAIHRNWQQALSYCAEKNMENKIWRLPDINELKTLFYPNKGYTLPFKIHKPIWSSTSNPNLREGFKAYVIYPDNGRVISIDKKPPEGLHTLCVANLFSQATESIAVHPPLLQSIRIKNPNIPAIIDKDTIEFRIPYAKYRDQYSLSIQVSKLAKIYINDTPITTSELLLKTITDTKISIRNQKFREDYTITFPVMLPVLDTGQKQCFNHDIFYPQFQCGYLENLEFPGEDANFLGVPLPRKFSPPASSAKFPAEKVTIDQTSGLIWKTCSEGTGGKLCQKGKPKKYTWQQAQTICSELNQKNNQSGYGGYKKWRLPEITELTSIIDRNYAKPAIDENLFPRTFRYFYWTASRSAYSTKDAWAINFTNGKSNYVNPKNDVDSLQSNQYMVRCVAGPKPPQPDFVDVGNGTIHDRATDLYWQKCLPGQYGQDCEGYIITLNWQSALEYCSQLRLAGRSWRLPNVNELQSMLNYKKYYNALEQELFRNIKFPFYTFWTSTSSIRFSSDFYAFTILVDYGNIQISPKFYAHSTRCVSGGIR